MSPEVIEHGDRIATLMIYVRSEFLVLFSHRKHIHVRDETITRLHYKPNGCHSLTEICKILNIS